MKRGHAGPPVPFLPTTREEMDAAGWDRCDILLVSGDAYVDHPAFGIALIGRWLESRGYRVAVLPQPDWTSQEPFFSLGVPRLFVGVSSGAMDSLVNHYTALNRPRSNDDYSEGGLSGKRPDRALLRYVARIRQAMPGVPVVMGGIEGSLRRVSHYDFWSDRVRKSVLLDAKANILVYGMGERAVQEIARRLEEGRDLMNIRGTAVYLGAKAFDPSLFPDAVWLPSHEEVFSSRRAFMEMTRMIERESNPANARLLLQRSDTRVLVISPPQEPLSCEEMDEVYSLPFARAPHPSYRGTIPAFAMIRDSLTVVRGCAGGCSFCALALHQGRAIQCRSEASVVSEARRLKRSKAFRGVISDVGGPTANLYGLGCGNPRARDRCRRSSCLFPAICRYFSTDHDRYVRLLRALRSIPGIRRVLVSSGIRFDVALRDERFLEELIAHHVPGHLKVAPEHLSDAVLKRMRKPRTALYRRFQMRFREISLRCAKEQYLVPYLMAGFPGCTLDDMKRVERELRREGIRPQQVQSFLPTPMTMATAMYHTGLDPETGGEIHVSRTNTERQEQLGCLLYASRPAGNRRGRRRRFPKGGSRES